RPADPRRVVTRREVARKDADRLAAELLAERKDALERAERLGGDLVPCPGLQVHRASGLDLLPLTDLIAVGLDVVDERARVEQLERRAGNRGRGPDLVAEELYGRLVA